MKVNKASINSTQRFFCLSVVRRLIQSRGAVEWFPGEIFAFSLEKVSTYLKTRFEIKASFELNNTARKSRYVTSSEWRYLDLLSQVYLGCEDTLGGGGKNGSLSTGCSIMPAPGSC